MSRATWKRTERDIAGIIGGARVPVSGRKRGDQLPVAIIHRHGTRHAEDIVCLRLVDFTAWFGPVAESEGE